MDFTKQDVKEAYYKLKDELGHQPSAAEYYGATGITEYILIKLYGSKAYGKLVAECGGTPRPFANPKTPAADVLTQWGQLARAIQTLPTAADWTMHRLKPGASKIRASQGFAFSEIPQRFLQFAAGNMYWNDVVALIPPPAVNTAGILPAITTKPAYAYTAFIPPAVADLVSLATDKKSFHEFEKRVSLVMQLLGFQVTVYGQGSGRNPDCVARAPGSRYAVLVDSKARTPNYNMRTDDRQIIEYINKHTTALNKEGYNITYFLIVSSAFGPLPQTALRNIKRHTGVDTTLISAGMLLKLLATKIEHPHQFDLDKLKELFCKSGIIEEKEVNRFIKCL